MFFKRSLVAILLGSSILAGCDEGDAVSPTTFDNAAENPLQQTTAAAPAQKQDDVPGMSAAPGAVVEEVPPARQDVALTQFVNPLIGSGEVPKSDVPGSTEYLFGGFVNPGAKVPFGMVSWGPETNTIDTIWSPRGYHHDSNVIQGFPMINLNGVGCETQAPFKVQPIGNVTDEGATFSHANEVAKPGYYRVEFDNHIETELTATVRTGSGRFTFPAGSNAMLWFNYGKAKVDKAARTISASATGGGFCGSDFYEVYFYAKFDQPFTVSDNDTILTFAPTAGAKTMIGMKAGVSYVSTANARENLEAESAALSFDEVRKNADAAWNERLNSIQVTGGSADERVNFYTALYHSFFAPSVYNDFNGQYMSFDGRGTVEKVEPGRTHYTTFSSWDSYRSLAPLQSLLAPTESSDMAQSLINDARQCGGVFPMWVEGNSNSNIMPGDGASIIVAQNYAFGARNFDTAAARQIMLDMALGRKAKCRRVQPLPHIEQYIERGYLRSGEGSMMYNNTATSNTLEYVSTDFAISRFLAALDKPGSQLLVGNTSGHAADLLKRSGYWRNLFNPGWSKIAGQPYPQLQPHDEDDNWMGFELATNEYREGNAEQYGYMVPHDIRGLFRMLVKYPKINPNSEADAVARLDEFTKYLAGGERAPYLWLGNEPSFATPFMYNWTSQPYKTQALVSRLRQTLYKNSPQGLPGNEDEGALSGWYVWSALGLYPEILAEPGLTLTSPLFSKAVVWQGKRRLFTITAPEAPAPYVQGLLVDGKPHHSTWLPFHPMKGERSLDFTLGAAPSCWASEPAADGLPPSFAPDGSQTPALKPVARCAMP
ncbi:GH92 family glycosyl hydrolase [Phyllobacterium sp. 0TCS1.6C]|uniref:GH92 family glycosyl hydrolase n=1 Tax=unclassified Phyllobacterium TaxID=2638441 RepID=UPI00226528F5|nr:MULTISPECIES: GH92 family glycosyl hydrolase [unclassified Phyllobacterium]MCX8278813.1 GH92 family glycosyl hydrolase [Phyllobacterium sp. 0TCS1.6C]MCX8293358.1 GH92 family glycosyl hydrolase [Phyllobacterium sp. 0TCS1.6A]